MIHDEPVYLAPEGKLRGVLVGIPLGAPNSMPESDFLEYFTFAIAHVVDKTG